MKKRFRIAAATCGKILLLAVLVAGPLRAACGLNFCPVPKPEEGGNSGPLQLGLLTKYTTFAIAGREGAYTEAIPKAEYLWGKYFLGLSASLVYLDDDSGTVFGLGNPLAYAEYRMSFGPRNLLFLGSQFEIPLGNSKEGIAGDHFMALPYLSATRFLGAREYLSGTLGLSSVLSGDAIGGHSAVTRNVTVVNPHGDMELHYRATLGADWKEVRISPEVFVRGQYVLSEGEKETRFTSAGAGLLFHVLPHFGLQGNMEYPITSPERFGWRGGLNASLTL